MYLERVFLKGLAGVIIAALLSACVYGTALALSSDEGTATPGISDYCQFHRAWGNDYFGTMKSVYEKYKNGALENGYLSEGGTVILASDVGYWDALSASGYAGNAKAPILLTGVDDIPTETSDILQSLQPSKVIVVGGEAVVSEEVVNQAKSLLGDMLEVTRIAGETAVDTACRINRYYSSPVDMHRTAFVVASSGFQDAMSIAPYCFKEGASIYLANSDGTVDDEVKEVLNWYDDVYFVGGPMVVADDDEIQKCLNYAGRLYGATAVDTSRAVANWELAHGMGVSKMGIASADSWYDAVVSAPFCAMNNSVMILATNNETQAIDEITMSRYREAAGYVLGGTAVLSDSIFEHFPYHGVYNYELTVPKR